MERPIMKDVLFLQQPSEPATEADKSLIFDLQDTLNAHRIRRLGGRNRSFPGRSHRSYSMSATIWRGRSYRGQLCLDGRKLRMNRYRW